MRDKRGRFVRKRRKLPDWLSSLCAVGIVVLFIVVATFFYMCGSMAANDDDLRPHVVVKIPGMDMTYFFDGEKVSAKTWDREITLQNKWAIEHKDMLRCQRKCQRAWRLLQEDPREGRRAYKILDE